MNRTLQMLAALPMLTALLAGCSAEMAPPVMAPPAAAAMPAPAPLARSYFTKDASASLTEDDLQHVLEAPIDLQFPARVGVVPLSQPFDAHSHASIATRSVASRDFAAALAGSPNFTHVSDVSTELPNAGGIEGLRALAARYRMRYLILYSERFEDTTHVNGLAALYPTLIGMFVVPGVTVQSTGLAQADLLDVRTGTVLFSVVEPIQVSSKEFMIGAARAHRELQRAATAEAAKRLAQSVTGQTRQMLAYADEMASPAGKARRASRLLPAPVLADAPPSTSGAQRVARP
jgi:rhombotail lipoprotein